MRIKSGKSKSFKASSLTMPSRKVFGYKKNEIRNEQISKALHQKFVETTHLTLFPRMRVERLDDAHGPGVDDMDAVAVPAPDHVMYLK